MPYVPNATAVFNQIKLAEAFAVLAEAGAIGIVVQYSNRSSAPITLKALVLEQTAQMIEIIGTRSQTQEYVFLIPMQPVNTPIFPPVLGLTIDDTIMWNGDIYKIDTWDDLKTYGGVFKIVATKTQTKQILPAS